MTDDLLRIVSEMETVGGAGMSAANVLAFAARIRACVSPEQVAFVEACADYWLYHRAELNRIDEMPDGRWKRMVTTYAALLAAQEKGK